MKAKQLSEVRDIVNSAKFRSWFDTLVKARLAAREAQLRHEELLTQIHLMEFRAELAQRNATDTLYRAAGHEDAAAAIQAESSDLENKSLNLVGEYERQRALCTELWGAMGAAETPDRAPDARARKLREEYERETAKKNRMWEEVENLWAMSLEKNLAVVENKAKGKRVRRESETLFANAEKANASAQALKSDGERSAREREKADEAVLALMSGAAAEFDAIVHEDFLYWSQRENNKAVYVSPLFNDSSNYNLELNACRIYQCSSERGVDFLEPIVETAVRGSRVDTRLDDFFVKGRAQAGTSSQNG